MAYEPKTWNYNDIITEGELNRMEQGISDAHQIGEQAQITADSHASRHATGGPDEITPASIGAATAADLAAHLNDDARHTTQAEKDNWNNKVSRNGDKMLGPLVLPEYELENSELVRQYYVTFGSNANEKVDIEFPKIYFNGTLEVTLVSEWNEANASGSITKIIHFSVQNDGSISFNDSIYLTASPFASNHYAISDVIFDPVKDKFVVKIAHRSNQSSNVRIIIKSRTTRAGLMNIFKQISLSSIYTTDATIYPAPYDAKKYILVGTGSPEGVVTASVGRLYLRTDGGASTTLYVKESGTGNTGWKAVQTA